MYNSIFTYAIKSIKGKVVFSIFFILTMSQTFTLFSIYNLVLRLNINKNDLASFFRTMSIYSTIVVAALVIIMLAFFATLYSFSQNKRMFAALRIFGASRLSLIKLNFLEIFIYTAVSLFIMVIELGIFYLRYSSYIVQMIDQKEILASLASISILILLLFIILIAVSVITSFIFIIKEPYENMRGTL